MNQNLNEKISIIIPAYNAEKYIEKCIESLINQTYKNIEIIIVNDGSTDNTLNIINNYAQKDNRIIVINQENQGVSESRNNALKHVTGDYIMFVDSDDWLDLNASENVLKKALEKKADIVMFGYVREYANKSLTKSIFEDEEIAFEGDEVKDKLQRRIFGPIDEELRHPEKLNAITPVCMKLYKKDVIDNIFFTNIKTLGTCEDGYFNIFAFERAQKVIFIKKYFYHYRKDISGSSLTQRKDIDIYDKSKTFYSKLIELVKEKQYKEQYIVAVNNRLALNLIENGIVILKSNINIKESYKRNKKYTQ